jgi:hypothetical protein
MITNRSKGKGQVSFQQARQNPMYGFLIVLTIASSVGLQAWRTLFNNFAVEIAGLSGDHIGVIQSVREIPGLLALLAVYFLLIVKEHYLSALSVVLLGIGITATGFFPSFFGLICTTLIMSFGFHYFETTNQSLTLQYFPKTTAPWVFGKQRSLASVSNIVIGLLILVAAGFLGYVQLYILVGAVIVFAGLWGLTRNPVDKGLPPQRKQMVFRRRYWLFYLLTFLSGARRQIFIAFAVLLMVEVFNYSVREITILFVVNNIINYFLAPYIGKAIILFGERKVLSVEYASLILVFLGYTLVQSKLGVAALYILDHIFFNFAIAIRTYFQKVGDPRDIAPSMAVGFTINHGAAVILPAVGGMLWMIDYRIPFVAGATLSLFSLLAVQKIDAP